MDAPPPPLLLPSARVGDGTAAVRPLSTGCLLPPPKMSAACDGPRAVLLPLLLLPFLAGEEPRADLHAEPAGGGPRGELAPPRGVRPPLLAPLRGVRPPLLLAGDSARGVFWGGIVADLPSTSFVPVDAKANKLSLTQTGVGGQNLQSC